MVKFRKAMAKDRMKVLLLKDAFAHELGCYVKRDFDAKNIWVAEDNGKIVGFLQGTYDRQRLVIDLLYWYMEKPYRSLENSNRFFNKVCRYFEEKHPAAKWFELQPASLRKERQLVLFYRWKGFKGLPEGGEMFAPTHNHPEYLALMKHGRQSLKPRKQAARSLQTPKIRPKRKI